MKKLITLLSIPLIAATVNSCRESSQDFYKYKEIDGLRVNISKDNQGSMIRVSEIEKADSHIPLGSTSFVSAADNFPVSKGNIGDGRFDEIKLYHVPKGHPLEKYANLDYLTKLYNEVNETGKEFGDKK
jgi:hypothetical protein